MSNSAKTVGVYTQVSAGEITAGTETALRSFSPEDVASMAAIHGTGDALTTNPLSQFAATTSAQLAGVISDETGSGALVFATSPTLTTPVLGTPTSGTLTNCTGLPISTGVSGLGTGVASFLATPSSANLATAVTDETGSGALVFATSPTLVTPALGTPSSGTLTSCTGLPNTTGVTGSRVVNCWKSVITTAGSTTTAIPGDDTIPQSTEGAEITTITLTPSSTSNFLKFVFSGHGASSNAAGVLISFAWFKDSDTSASFAGVAGRPTTNVLTNINGVGVVQVSSTSSQTWKLRMGPASGTLYWLQTSSTEVFSTSDQLYVEIQEIAFN